MELLTIAGRADEALLDAFYAELYLPAFAHQREPLEAWKRRLWDDRGLLEVAITVAGEDLRGAPRLAGGVVAEHYPRSNTGFLTYLVVAPDARRAGLGRALLERARDALAARGALVLGEVSDPRTADDPAEARARLARFQRWGARVLELAYVQPDLGAGLGRDRRLRLLAFFAGAPPPDVDGARLAAFLRELYAITEGAGWEDDEARAMLAAIPARVALEPP